MSTIEKLIVQIFERKNSIIEQVKHQIDLYDQQLASRLIIDGIAPPSWLWNPGSHSQSSDPTELKKEELISELLLPRPQPSISYSTGHNALYNKPVVSLNKEDLPVDPFTEPRAFIKGLDGPTFVPQCDHNNNVGCFLNCVPELEPQTTSPRDRTYVPDDPFPEPRASIKGLDEPTFVPRCDHNNNVGCFLNGVPELEPQTTSPRDRAYVPDDPFPEPRASIKGLDGPTVVPQCDHINIGSVLCSVSDLEPQATSPPDRTDARSVDISPKPDKSLAKFQRSKSRQKALEIRNSATTGARSRLRYRKDNIVSSGESAGFMIATLQSYHVNEAELVKPLDMTSESNGIRQEKVENGQSKERGSNIDSGRITRSRSSCSQSSHVHKSLEPKSSSYIVSEDGVNLESIGKSLQQHNPVNESLKVVNVSDITNESRRVSEAVIGDKPCQDNESNGHCGRVTRSRSSCQQFDSVNVSSKIGNSSDIVHIDGSTLQQFQVQVEESFQGLNQSGRHTDFPTDQGTQICAGSSSPGQKDLELYAVNTRKHEREGNAADEYVGTSTKSHSCTSQGMSEHGNSKISGYTITESRHAASNKFQTAQGNQISAGISSPSQNDLEMCTMNAREYSGMRNVAHECTSRNTQSSHSTKGKAAPANSNISVQTNSQPSAASPVKLLGMYEADDNRKALVTDVNVLPLTDITGIINHERCGATFEETEIVSGSPVEACMVSSGPEQEGAKLRVGLEALASGLPTDSPMLVKPKQLDFDGIENYSLDATFSTSLEEKGGKIMLDKQHATLLEPVWCTKESSQPRRSVSVAMDCSWPQYKRRKLEDQLPHVLSAPPSMTVKALQRINRNAIGRYLDGEEDNSQAVLSSPHTVRKVAQSNDMSPSLESGQNVNCLILGGSEDSRKQLDIDGLVKYNLNATCSSCLEEKGGEISLEKRPSSLLVPVHFSNESSQPRRSLSLAMDCSWPQYKRRKMEDEVTHVLSAPPGLTVKALQSIDRNAIGRYLNGEEDNSQAVASSPHKVIKVAQSNDLSSHSESDQNENCLILGGSEDSAELKDEEGDLSLEGRHKSESTSAYEPEQLEPSCSSCFRKPETGDSQGSLMEEVGVSSQTSTILDGRSVCTVEENQNWLHLEIRSDQEKAENLTCVERIMHEKKSHMGEDALSYYSVGSLRNQYLDAIDADQYMPVLEGFIVEADDRQPQVVAGEVNEENLSNSTLEHASILEQRCKSVSMHTPLSSFSTTYKFQQTPHLYQSVPNGLLEHMDLKNTLDLVDDSVKQFVAGPSCMKHEVNHAFQLRSYSDELTFPRSPFDWDFKNPYRSPFDWDVRNPYRSPFDWDVRNPYRSPTGKLWERTRSSNSGCSEKHRSSNPELTCFPIAEDPNICEEMGNTDEVIDPVQDDISSIAIKNSTKRGPLADITECYENTPALVCEAKTFHDRCSLDSLNTEINSIGTQSKVKQKPRNHYNRKKRCTSKAKENQNLSLHANGGKRDRFSKPKQNSLRIGHITLPERESRHNNIVTSITSFVPLVQQKQAAAVITGKRDIKVKALEAAEAAKRLEEKRENERKMKKEAMKLERARLEQENLRQLELKKKKKEEAQKKKDADIVVRKRGRQEEEKKEKEGKRKRIEEARRQQREQEEKLHAGKQARETQCRTTDVRGLASKDSKDDKGKHKKIEQEKRDDNHGKIAETQSRSIVASTANVYKESIIVNDGEALHDRGDVGTVKSNMDKVAEFDNMQTSGEYDISPYQGSDDEEEEEDDKPNNKFIPSWASSKNSMALVASSQQQIDVNLIFSPDSFCSIDEVLMPRKK